MPANRLPDSGHESIIYRRSADLGSAGHDPEFAKGIWGLSYGLGVGVAVKGLGVSVGTGVTIFT